MPNVKLGCAVAAVLLFSSTAAFACHVTGSVMCDPAGAPLPGVRIDFVSTTGDPWSGYAVTDATGRFTIALPVRLGCYTATIALQPGQTAVVPGDGQKSLCITDTGPSYTWDPFVIEDVIADACNLPTATQGSTWGALKSAYR